MRTRNLLAVAAVLAAPFVAELPASAATPRTFHVDCLGDDARDGLSPATAWRTLARATRATLAPGDKLLLKRGCTWDRQRLDLPWHGTATSPILVSAYGTGNKPRIRNGLYQDLKFTGSYTIAEHLELDHTVTNVVVKDGCSQPVADVYGVNFTSGAHHNTIRSSDIHHATIGVHMGAQSSANKVIGNTIRDNDVKKAVNTNPAADLGAWGVVVASDDNEIASNTFRNNRARCRNAGAPVTSTSVEVWAALRTSIHHNWVYGDRNFVELGGPSTKRAADTKVEYNRHTSSEPGAVFLITHGAGNTAYGPVLRTTVRHNSVLLTADGADGVTCNSGCSAEVLTLRSNVISATRKAVYADAPFAESHGVYWTPLGYSRVSDPAQLPKVVFQVPAAPSSTSSVSDPRFVDPAAGNLRLGTGSPAKDRVPTPAWSVDLANLPSLVGAAADAGSFEAQ